MAGMHRDKCGAAAVAGFFQVKDTTTLPMCCYRETEICKLYSCNLYAVEPYHMLQMYVVIPLDTVLSKNIPFNPASLTGSRPAEAQTPEGCGIHGHGEEQCWSR